MHISNLGKSGITPSFWRRIARRFHTILDPLRGPSGRRHGLVGPAHMWRKKRAFQINFLKKHGLQPHHRLIDVGCGTLRGGIPIIDYLDAENYTGLDVREMVLEEARMELVESGLEHKQPRLALSDDFDSLELGAPFDYVWGYAVLIHMTDDISAACMRMVSRHLRVGGRFYANVYFSDRQEGRWDQFPVVFRSLDFYSQMAQSNNFEMRVLGTLTSLGHHCGHSGDYTQMLEFTRVDHQS